ncbi:tRNA 2-selenouridine(34) synthase MnmH [Glaciimonas sp. CA11.2]|uniref:tRNA 2-selenouridine(34) synthase MnmH n=2 Tax=Glaciimonas sp. CA11.2 TaxID=3048601 RepID=UPI002B23DB7F|nr:tRNA 2-selenouridine(34) synthase MnmH [Glaciimonas sp. CA11.2]
MLTGLPKLDSIQMYNFSDYDLIIDARCQREYEEDHIPGAVNMPVVNNDEYAEVGTLHRTDKMGAYRIGVAYSLRNIARYLEEEMLQYSRKSRILVYCFRGGKRSKLWIDALETIGYRVDKLEGGWKGYRRWVNAQLASVPTEYHYHVLSGPTGCGKTRLLYALEDAGAQVLDLEDIAVHRGSVLGEVPGQKQPSQKYFDSLLLRKFSAFDPKKPIWVEAESKKIGNVQLPDALLESMRKGQTIVIETDMAQRVLLWREDYRHFEEDPFSMLERLVFLKPLVGNKEFAAWEALAEEKAMPQLFEQLMRNHYDPTYRRSILRNYPEIDASPVIPLHDLSPSGLSIVAKTLCGQFR